MKSFLPGPGPLAPAPHSTAAVGPTTYNQALTGALSFAGAAPLFGMQRILTGGLSFTGALTRILTGFRTLTGALSFTGAAVTFSMQRVLAAAGFTPTGSLAASRLFVRSLAAAALSFTGSAPLFAMTRTLSAAAFTPAGVLTRTLSLGRVLTGALSFSGSISRIATRLRTVTGSLSFTGAPILAGVTRKLTATLNPAGALIRSTSHKFPAGSFTPTGALTSSRAFLRTITAALSFTGTRTAIKSTIIPVTLNSALSFIGGNALVPNPAQYPDPALYPYYGMLLIQRPVHLAAASLNFLAGSQQYPDPILYPGAEVYPYGGAILFKLFRTLPAVLLPTSTLARNTGSFTRLFTATLQPQVIFLKTSARIILIAALMTTSFSAQKISSTVGKALFGALQAAGSLSSIYNPGSAEHGGGGWGVPMPDSYFQRYKPTLRRQRMKV